MSYYDRYSSYDPFDDFLLMLLISAGIIFAILFGSLLANVARHEHLRDERAAFAHYEANLDRYSAAVVEAEVGQMMSQYATTTPAASFSTQDVDRLMSEARLKSFRALSRSEQHDLLDYLLDDGGRCRHHEVDEFSDDR